MLIYLAQYLLDNYHILPEVTNLVDSTDIYLMPSMNPDGFNRSKVRINLLPTQFIEYFVASPHHTIPFHTIPYHSIPYHAIQCCYINCQWLKCIIAALNACACLFKIWLSVKLTIVLYT